MAAFDARLLALTAGLAFACPTETTLRAQAYPAPGVNSSEHPWAVVTLIGGNLLAPSNVALDGAMRKVLTEPGRHPVDFFSGALDVQRFPQAQLEDEMVALLAKKYATTHIDAVVTLGTSALYFAEKHRSRIWPDARILFQVVPATRR